jgi:hypothetical protein
LASLLINSVEERVANELSELIVAEAVVEAFHFLQQFTFYRFYHVFARGELEALVELVPSLTLLSVSYEYANFGCVLQKK